MEFRETLLAAQRNQQQKSSESLYYKARFDPPKKEQKQRDRLSANIQKFLAKKDEEEKQKKIETQKKRDDLLAMRDPKALRKIQKTLKTIKSANKSVLEDAVDRDNTAFTLTGPEQPDQDDYGYESQEAAAIYAKMMQKYSKIPDEPKFSVSNHKGKKDLKGTMERVKHALQHEDEPVPHKRRRRTENGGANKEDSPTHYEPEKKEEKKPEKPKFRKPMPPPMDFNQLLKLAEQKKSEPVGPPSAVKKESKESEHERLMTKRQKREYEEEMARRQRRQERLDADKISKRPAKERDERPPENDRQRPSGFGRIPKLNDKNSVRNNSPRPVDKESSDRDRVEKDKADKMQRDKDRIRQERERLEREKEKIDREKDKIDRERLDRLKAERERIDRELEKLTNTNREKSDRPKSKVENGKTQTKLSSSDNIKKSIDLKSHNTYRIDKNSNERKSSGKTDDRHNNMNGHSSQGKAVPKSNKEQMLKNVVKDKAPMLKQPPKPENGKKLVDGRTPARRPDDRLPGKPQPGSSQKKTTDSFDFDKHVGSIKKDTSGKNGARPAGNAKKRPHPDDGRKKQNRRVVDSESEYDSEMDDFIDDGEVDTDYSKHIKEIFGYDKSKYRDVDDDDDPTMESSFARQQREEFISKKLGIMEDLEDMRMEAMEKKKSKKSRRISDD